MERSAQEVLLLGRGGSLVSAGGGGESFPKVEAENIGAKTVGERRLCSGGGGDGGSGAARKWGKEDGEGGSHSRLPSSAVWR